MSDLDVAKWAFQLGRTHQSELTEMGNNLRRLQATNAQLEKEAKTLLAREDVLTRARGQRDEARMDLDAEREKEQLKARLMQVLAELVMVRKERNEAREQLRHLQATNAQLEKELAAQENQGIAELIEQRDEARKERDRAVAQGDAARRELRNAEATIDDVLKAARSGSD